MVAVAVGLLLALRIGFGATAAAAAFYAILLLMGPARHLSTGWRWAAAGWALAVSAAGLMIGPHGWWAVLAGVVVVALVQGAFHFGQMAQVSRSPVNFMLFAGLAEAGADTHQVLVGTALGAALMLVIGAVIQHRARPTRARHDPFVEWLTEGALLAVACLVVVLVAELTGFPRVGWALLTLCVVMSVQTTARMRQALGRVSSTIVGALLATVAALLPEPVPLVLAVICAVLAIAYLNKGDQSLFLVFLTPTLLLTASGEVGSVVALERVEAVLGAAAIALLTTWLGAWLRGRLVRRRTRVGVRG